MPLEPEELLILGVTIDGRLFRPRDWAERLCGALASYNNRRLVYSHLVHPVMREEHHFVSVVVETELKIVSPQAYKFVMDFVRDNQLKIMIGRKAVRQEDLVIIETSNCYRWASTESI